MQTDMNSWPFAIIKVSNNRIKILVEYQNKRCSFFPEEILAMLISYLKQNAENYLGHPVTNAVLTVPARFDYKQRGCIKMAGQLAGLNVLRIVSSPVCAAITYAIDQRDDEKNNQNQQENTKNIPKSMYIEIQCPNLCNEPKIQPESM